MKRVRLLFALIGALGCLLAAFCLEALFTLTRTPFEQNIDDRVSPILILRSDLTRRLEAAGGKSGEVQISLSWNNINDLDLSCVSPLGETIDFRHTVGRSGGILDVDSNAGEPFTLRPVENIVWPYGKAPAGHYRVFVNIFRLNRDRDRFGEFINETPFRLAVIVRGKSKVLNDTIRIEEGRRMVYEFDTTGGTFDLEGLPAAILRAILVTSLWTGLLGVTVTLAIALGQMRFYDLYYGETLLNRSELQRLVGWGGLSGLCAGAVGQLLFSLLSAWFSQLPTANGRLAGWLLLASVFAVMLGKRMPNFRTRTGIWISAVLSFFWFLGTLRSLVVATNPRISASPLDALLVPFRIVQEAGGTEGRLTGAGLLGCFIGFLIVLTIPERDEEELDEEPVAVRMTLTTNRMRMNRSSPVGSLRPQRSQKEKKEKKEKKE